MAKRIMSKEKERKGIVVDDDDGDGMIADPAFFSIDGSTINAALEAARDIKSPIIIQFSNGGSAFVAGKGLSNKNQEASVIGAVAGAQVYTLLLHTPQPIVDIPFFCHHDALHN